MSGIQTKNLPLSQSVDELVGNDSQGNTVRTRTKQLAILIGTDLVERITAAGGMALVETVQAGLDATTDGDYFSVPSEGDDYLILYRNDSGSAEEINRAPSVEAVEHFVGDSTLSTNWDTVDKSGFYRAGAAGETQGVPADHAHLGLFHIEKGSGRKHQLAFRQAVENPQVWVRNYSGGEWGDWKELAFQDSTEALVAAVDETAQLALVRGSEPATQKGDFFTGAAEEQGIAFAVADKEGRALFRVRNDGVQKVAWRGEFHLEAGPSLYAWVDVNRRIFYAVDESGVPRVGGGIDPDQLPHAFAPADPGQVYLDYQTLRRAPSDNSFFAVSPLSQMQSIDDLYNFLDDVQDEFSDYIEKEVLGQDGLGNDIVKYIARPAEYLTRWYDVNEPEVLEKPKIVLFGAIHGGEKYGAITNAQFLRELCYRWKEDDRLAYLRWGMELHLVPTLNPSGFNAHERYNHNDVDLNRNFPTGWEDADPLVRGSAPASEIETQIALAVITDNLDACAFIDHHNAGSLNADPYPFAYWIGTERPETIEIARMSCDHMARFLRKEFAYADQSNSVITRLVDSYGGTLTKHVQGEFDKNAFTLETGTGFESVLDRQKHAMEALVNLIYMCVRKENMRRVRDTDFTYP